jgi:hypothetical protein
MTIAANESDLGERYFDRTLWFSMLGAPVIWLVFLQTAYLVVLSACSSGDRTRLHICAAVFLGLIILTGVISLAQWNKSGRKWPSQETGGASGRRQTMAMIGILQSALFSMLIMTSWAAILILDPCQGLSRS